MWNVRGVLFVGDAGALLTGAILGGLALELVRLRPDLIFVPPILLLPYLSDVLLTLAWRTKHGKKLWVAHLDHTYQIAIKAGLKHTQVAGVHAVWTLNAAVVAVGASDGGRLRPRDRVRGTAGDQHVGALARAPRCGRERAGWG